MIRILVINKSNRLFYENIFLNVTIKKDSVDIQLDDKLVHCKCQGKENANGYWLDNRTKFFSIDALSLLKPFGKKPRFVLVKRLINKNFYLNTHFLSIIFPYVGGGTNFQGSLLIKASNYIDISCFHSWMERALTTFFSSLNI